MLSPGDARASTVRRRRAGLDELDGFVLEEGRGLYRPVGSVSFDEAVALVRAAIAAARSESGPGPPGRYDGADRVSLARHIPAVLGGRGVGGGGERERAPGDGCPGGNDRPAEVRGDRRRQPGPGEQHLYHRGRGPRLARRQALTHRATPFPPREFCLRNQSDVPTIFLDRNGTLVLDMDHVISSGSKANNATT